MQEQTITLYGAEYSVYTRIARLALKEKGVDYSFEQVDIFAEGGPPEGYLKRHPFNRIPAFMHSCMMDFICSRQVQSHVISMKASLAPHFSLLTPVSGRA
jgi:hypothetical protein